MSKQNQKEWRCPYCDGLNDWQDEVCQICGDGKRDEVVPSGKTASSARSEQSGMQYQTWHQNTYSQEPTRRDVQQERRQSAPELETRFLQREPEVRKPELSVAPVTKPKRKKHWGLIPVAVVLIAGGIYGFSVHKANALVNDIDFKLLQNAPYDSMDKFKSWAESQGYEITTSKDGTGFFTDYSVDPGKSDWNISVSEGSNGIEITYKADGQNLNAVYKKLSDVIEEKNWKYDYLGDNERPTFEDGITGKKYRSTQFWIDEKNNWYEIALKDKEITITREDSPVSSEELAAEVDLDFLQNIGEMNSYVGDENWKQKFNESYGNVNFQPADMVEGDNWCRAEFRYYPSDQENKKEVLRYLKNGIQDVKGKNMQLKDNAWLGENGFSYSYEIESALSHIEISSISSLGWIQVTIEGNKDW